MTDPKHTKKQSRSRFADEPPRRQTRPARQQVARRPTSVDQSQRPRRPRASSGGQNIYSHSGRQPRDRMVDISSHSSQAQRARRARDVRYYDGFDPNDAAPPPVRRGRQPRSGYYSRGKVPARRRRKRHIARNILCVLLAIVIVVFAWLTILFTKMDRTHNSDMSQYVQQPESAPTWAIKSNPLVTNILLIGMENQDGGSPRSDSIMLLSIDRIHMKMKMTSFLRDTYVQIPGHGKQKLNAAFAYGGPALTMQTLENNYRIKIDKYLAVGFDSFEAIVDAVGGIDVTLDQALCNEFAKGIGQYMQPGKHTLTGVVALYYTRIRNVGNDYGRTERQREVMGQLIKKLAGLGPFKLNKVLSEIMPKLWTNIPAIEMTGIALTGFPVALAGQKTQQIPANNTFQSKTISGVGATLVPDLETNCKLLREFIYEDSSTE